MTNAVLTALDYRCVSGWAPIPVPFKAKGPRLRAWQRRRFDAKAIRERFSPKMNVGVLLGELSGGLIDIDIDALGVADLADRYLSPTNSIFGRDSKPSSHRLYRATGPMKTTKFADPVDHAMLVEVRSTGSQTVFPGSVHPSGEAIRWERDVKPTVETAPDQLLESVVKFAAAVLVRKYCGTHAASPFEQEPGDWISALFSVDPKLAKKAGQWLGLPPPGQSVLPVFHSARPYGTEPSIEGPSVPRDHPYVAAAIYGELTAFRAAKPGTRNDTLNKAAFNLARWIKPGFITEDEVERGLIDAAREVLLVRDDGLDACLATIRSGLRAGKQAAPRVIPQRSDCAEGEQVIEFCDPTYPASTGSLEEARQKVRDAMTAYLAETERYHAAMATL
jgi:hypothetical protein